MKYKEFLDPRTEMSYHEPKEIAEAIAYHLAVKHVPYDTIVKMLLEMCKIYNQEEKQ